MEDQKEKQKIKWKSKKDIATNLTKNINIKTRKI